MSILQMQRLRPRRLTFPELVWYGELELASRCVSLNSSCSCWYALWKMGRIQSIWLKFPHSFDWVTFRSGLLSSSGWFSLCLFAFSLPPSLRCKRSSPACPLPLLLSLCSFPHPFPWLHYLRGPNHSRLPLQPDLFLAVWFRICQSLCQTSPSRSPARASLATEPEIIIFSSCLHKPVPLQHSASVVLAVPGPRPETTWLSWTSLCPRLTPKLNG